MNRHAVSTRIWHWLNLVCVVVLFMSGLNISNAHPWLYWGHWGFDPQDAWLHVARFPGWATIPEFYSLAQARRWHLLFAWPFAFGLLAWLLLSLRNGHIRRDLVTTRDDWAWRTLSAEIAGHLRLRFSQRAQRFNPLQKISYAIVALLALPLMVLTGLAMSPAIDASWPVLVDLFGGRQSARSIHFLTAWFLFGFTVVHVLMVLLSGPLRQIGGMITGGRAAPAQSRP